MSDEPTIAGGYCAACGHVFAPFQSYGCEVCGSDAVAAMSLPAVGKVVCAATVHVHGAPVSPTPFGVAEIALDSGPVIRVLTDGPVATGQRVASNGIRFAAA